MKKKLLGILLILALGMTACNYDANTVTDIPAPTAAAKPTVTPTPTTVPTSTAIPTATVAPTSTPVLTATPKPTATPVPTVTPKPTATPVPSATPKPTSTPVPTVTPKPTSTPVPTVTPKPTATPVPSVTPKPTATPTPTVTPKPAQAVTQTEKPLSAEVKKLLENAEIYENTDVRGTVCKSEEEANEKVRLNAQTYHSFAVIVEDAGYMHSAGEYMALYPEIERMSIESVKTYDNGICIRFTDVSIVYDADLCYAIRTGDETMLSGTEKEILTYLNHVIDLTGARSLEKAEAVKALHDYLVLNLKYDETYQAASHTPEGVMKNHVAVCEGYARTMQLLLKLAGIDSKIVVGTAGGGAHAWNLVKLDDEWYHVDVTWDDPIPDKEGRVRYIYFLKDDEYMSATHVWKSEISCNSTAYQVYAYREVLCNSFHDLQEVLKKQIKTEKHLTFCYPKGGILTADLIKDYIMNTLQSAISYYPEEETGDYLILEIINPTL
ncbi:MAG: transglutaminase domain-containing protein [Lachnospiraceae bacterium]|nr:transglutaminase domain-containing protein [Lachnospiraceae bacterium]